MMTFVLAPELEQLIAEQIERGRYSTPDEVVADGLRLIHEQETVSRMRLDDLRRELAIGQAALDRGEYRDYASGSEAMQDIVNEGRALRAAKRNAVS